MNYYFIVQDYTYPQENANSHESNSGGKMVIYDAKEKDGVRGVVV